MISEDNTSAIGVLGLRRRNVPSKPTVDILTGSLLKSTRITMTTLTKGLRTLCMINNHRDLLPRITRITLTKTNVQTSLPPALRRDPFPPHISNLTSNPDDLHNFHPNKPNPSSLLVNLSTSPPPNHSFTIVPLTQIEL